MSIGYNSQVKDDSIKVYACFYCDIQVFLKNTSKFILLPADNDGDIFWTFILNSMLTLNLKFSSLNFSVVIYIYLLFKICIFLAFYIYFLNKCKFICLADIFRYC